MWEAHHAGGALRGVGRICCHWTPHNIAATLPAARGKPVTSLVMMSL